MKYFCAIDGRYRVANGAPSYVIVEAATAFDAKAYAQRLLGTEGLIVHQTGDDAVASVELLWTGTDAGEHPDRHLEIRRRSVKYAEAVGPWTPWERVK